jgi:hypothetical protein
MTAAMSDLGRQRRQLADLVDIHPFEDWSPALLQAVNGVLEMYVAELGLKKSPAAVLELVKKR